MLQQLYKTVANAVVTLIGKVNWGWLTTAITGRYYKLTHTEQQKVKALLTRDYYIILTRRDTHLSTYAINFSHWFLSGFKTWGITVTR